MLSSHSINLQIEGCFCSEHSVSINWCTSGSNKGVPLQTCRNPGLSAVGKSYKTYLCGLVNFQWMWWNFIVFLCSLSESLAWGGHPYKTTKQFAVDSTCLKMDWQSCWQKWERCLVLKMHGTGKSANSNMSYFALLILQYSSQWFNRITRHEPWKETNSP